MLDQVMNVCHTERNPDSDLRERLEIKGLMEQN